jgi:hypothetical protein
MVRKDRMIVVVVIRMTMMTHAYQWWDLTRMMVVALWTNVWSMRLGNASEYHCY